MSSTDDSGRARQALLLSPFFHPEPISTGRYNAYLSTALVAAGYHITAVVSHPLYPDWQAMHSTSTLPGVTLLRGVPFALSTTSPILRSLVLEAWFTWHVVKTLIGRKERFSLGILVFPPVCFGLLPRRLFGATRCVVIVHDLLGIMAVTRRRFLRRIAGRLMGLLERATFRRCDRVVCLSSTMRDVIVGQYKIPAQKVTVCHPFQSMPSSSTERALADRFDPNFKHVVYSGALGEKQRPWNLYRLFELVCERNDAVMCHIFSRGPTFDQIKQWAASRPTDNMKLHDLVADESLAELYQRSCIQIVPQAVGTGAGAFPSKLPNLMAAGVPVFAICDRQSELALMIHESKCGVATDTNDPEALAQELIAFLKTVGSETHAQRRERLAPYVREKCSLDRLVQALITA